MSTEIEVFKVELKKMNLEKDDTLVLRVPHNMPEKYYQSLRETIYEIHKKCLIMSDFFDIGIIKHCEPKDEFYSLFEL